MRASVFAALALVPCLALGACASRPPLTMASLSAEEMARLERDCQARGGILVPSGRLTTQPSLDHLCRIHGGASRLDPPV